MADDSTLLNRYARTADEEAFREIVRRNLDLVYSVALRQVNGDVHLAEDVAQTVFADLARKAGSFRKGTVLTGWLHCAARFAGAKAVRSERRRNAHEQQALATDSRDCQELTNPDREQLQAVLDNAIGELSPTDRDAVLLRFFEGKDFRAIGTELGLSEDAAQKRVSRSLDKLRRNLARRDVTMTTTAVGAAITGATVQSAPATLAASITTGSPTTFWAGPTSVTQQLIHAMATIKTKALGIAIIAAAAVSVGTALFVQHRANSSLQADNLNLHRKLTDTEETLRSLQAASDLQSADLERLKEGQTELLRLRGEASQLRQQVSKMSKPPVEKSQPAAAPAQPVTQMVAFGSEVTDMGNATPERALISLMRAAGEGNFSRLSELIELPKNVSEQDAPAHYELFMKRLSALARDAEFVSVKKIVPKPDGMTSRSCTK